MDNDATVSEIERIRRQNNVAWMNILRVALESAPEKTKSILKQVNVNDKRISDLLRDLTGE